MKAESFLAICPECGTVVIFRKGQITRLPYAPNEQPYFAVCDICDSWLEGVIGQIRKDTEIMEDV